MKKTLIVDLLLIPLMVIAIPIVYGVEPPPNYCYTYVGPPVIGTLVYDQYGDCDDWPYCNYNWSFTGCCGDCFGACKASCNVKAASPLPQDFDLSSPANLINQTAPGWGPKNCNPKVNGVELNSLILDTVLKFEWKNVDRDTEDELVVDLVAYYYKKVDPCSTIPVVCPCPRSGLCPSEHPGGVCP